MSSVFRCLYLLLDELCLQFCTLTSAYVDIANPIVPGQTTDPALLHSAAGLGQKALLAKKFAKAR